MGRKKKILVGIVIFMILMVIILYSSLVSSKTIKSLLHVDSGDVEVNGKKVTKDITLNEGDLIETLGNGVATLILYESVIINVDPNTKITLDELSKKYPKISQEGGETWNKFTKMLGVVSYDNQIGNSIASVRATFFGFKEDKIIVGEGKVVFSFNDATYNVDEFNVIENVDGRIIQRKATKQELYEIKIRMEKSIESLKYLRSLEIYKKTLLVSVIKSTQGLTDEDIQRNLGDVDNELLDIDELAEKSPIKIESIEKIVAITKSIQQMKESIKKIDSQL